MFRQVGDEMLGMVCGPCDNPHNMAPIDNISIDGTNFHFEIVHEDAPTGGLEEPFANICNATIANNELRLAAVRSGAPPGTVPFEMTLVGPIRY